MSAIATTAVTATMSTVAVASVTVSSVNVSSVAVSCTKAEAEGEPVEDDRRLVDRRYHVIVRLRIDGLRAGVALSVGIQIVPRRARRRYLRDDGRSSRCCEGQSDDTCKRNFPHRNIQSVIDRAQRNVVDPLIMNRHSSQVMFGPCAARKIRRRAMDRATSFENPRRAQADTWLTANRSFIAVTRCGLRLWLEQRCVANEVKVLCAAVDRRSVRLTDMTSPRHSLEEHPSRAAHRGHSLHGASQL